MLSSQLLDCVDFSFPAPIPHGHCPSGPLPGSRELSATGPRDQLRQSGQEHRHAGREGS